MLNSAEQDNYPAHKWYNANNCSTYIRMVNITFERLKARNVVICQRFSVSLITWACIWINKSTYSVMNKSFSLVCINRGLFMNVDISKDAKSKSTSNMIPNMLVFIIVICMLWFELTLPPLIKIILKWRKRCIRLPWWDAF